MVLGGEEAVIHAGRVISDRYRIDRPLAAGGMGRVYAAFDMRIAVPVALKVAPAGDAAQEARFLREAHIGARLGQSAGFVRATDVGKVEDGRYVFLVMDLVEGGRPLDLTTGGVEDRLRRLARAARLVAEAHDRSVVHRDIKPSNFLQAVDGTIRLADFGLAKAIGSADDPPSLGVELTQPGLAFGTPPYMPPEQFRDMQEVDARADVYALGVMLHEALVGRPPYAGNPHEICMQHERARRGERPEARPSQLDPAVPPALDRLCWQALRLEHQDRLSSAAALAAQLEAFLLPEPSRRGAEPTIDRLESAAPQVEIVPCRTLCFAMEHAGVPIARWATIRNPGSAPLRGATLELELDPGFAGPTTLRVPDVGPGEEVEVDLAGLRPIVGRLRAVVESERGALRWALTEDRQTIASGTADVEVLAFNEWPGERAPAELLATFVLPNHPVVGRVMARVRDRLRAAGADPSIRGYEDRSTKRVTAVACALYETLQALEITYATTPASFESAGQKVRLPDAVLRDRMGNCLDITLLVAGCLEQMGLHPIVLVVEGHALPGVWLVDDPIGLMGGLVEEAATLRTLLALGEILVVETTAALNTPHQGFAAACTLASRHLSDETFRYAVDVHVLRDSKYGFRPLPIRAVDLGASEDESSDDASEEPARDDVRKILAEAAVEPDRAPTKTTRVVAPSRFRAWQDRLLDLSLRNKLLNFSIDGKGCLPLEVPAIGPFEDLFFGGRDFAIAPRPEDEHAATKVVRGEVSLQRRLDDLSKGLIHTTLGAEELLKRASKMISEARTALEEGGASTLYLAVGFLRWSESKDAERSHLAPLVLYPTSLDFDRRRRLVSFRRTADLEPLANVTLIEKVRRDHHVDLAALADLPTDDAGLDVPGMLKAAREAIVRMPGWEILEDVHLGLFTFSKFLMWKDLEENREVLLESQGVRRIALPPTVGIDTSELPPERLDDEVPPSTLPLVVDADGTQAAAVLSAVRGRSFALQGPPGTGKSQTITNIIACCLAAGKTVLFVAEKLAALEVVQRRLAEVGLADFCLELHSSKSNKRAVIESFGKTLDRVERQGRVSWDERSKDLAAARSSLNEYVRALHRRGKSGFSYYEASGKLLTLQDAPELVRRPGDRQAPGAELAKGILQFDESGLERMRESIRLLVERARAVGSDLGRHPLASCGTTEWSGAVEEAIREAAEDVLVSLDAVEAAEAPVRALLEHDQPIATATLTPLVALIEVLARGALPPALVAGSAKGVEDELRDHATAIEDENARRGALSERWTDGIYGAELAERRALFQRWSASWSLVRWAMLRSARAALLPHARGPLPADAQIAADHLEAEALLERGRLLREADRVHTERLEGAWDPASGTKALGELLELAREARGRATALGRLSGAVLGFGAPRSNPEKRAQLLTAGETLRDAIAELQRTESALISAASVKPGAAWKLSSEPDHRTTLREAATTWLAALPRLRAWCLFREATREAQGNGLGFLLQALVEGTVRPEQLEVAFERWFTSRWLARRRDEEPCLRSFVGGEHHGRVERFAALDREHVRLARKLVVGRLEAQLPPIGGAVSDASEVGLLRREVKKKTRHLAIRTLLEKTQGLVRRLKPCFLMSPLSVAQYLPAAGRRFDVLVFDEASQISTHDAIGAMGRGDQQVIVGDSKQLPPTTFFSRAIDDEEGESEFDEVESILEEATTQGVPEQRLGWHYRSRHESLIDFSNRHYYEDRLHVFPAARARSDDLGVRWHPVADGVYEGGSGSKGRTNPREAETLVAYLVATLKSCSPHERTFGVVTFNKPQQELITELLDVARGEHPEIEPHFASTEPVFVKNLENVQGDERDEILFSITYARDPRGKLRMHFGPLSAAGGERRLNVAVTRARRQLRVFSTLEAAHIELGRTKSIGTAHLRAFLDYTARHGGATPATMLDAPCEGPLERQVQDVLHELGYTTHSRVGCGAYRIDIAVVDPKRPEEYLLGIECDGPSYMSGATARDRDRLRQSVLEGMGWRLHRIWSLDWVASTQAERDRLVAALEKAKAAPRTPPRPLTPVDLATDSTPGDAVGDPVVAAAAPGPSRRLASGAGLVTGELVPTGQIGPAATVKLRPPPPSPIPADAVPAPIAKDPAVPYREAPKRLISAEPEDMIATDATSKIRERIVEVVNAEGPVHLEILVRRVIDCWSWERVGARARKRVVGEVEALARAKRVRVDGDFVWRLGHVMSVYRTAEAGQEGRSADEISVEEIAVAVRWVLEQNLSMEQEELSRSTARLLGIKRLGKQVAERMAAGTEHLRSTSICCVIEGDRVHWRHH